MPVRDVLQLGNPALREVAEPVEDPGSPEVATLVADLGDTLASWRRATGYGRAIAAPQIGVGKRVVFLNLGEPGGRRWLESKQNLSVGIGSNVPGGLLLRHAGDAKAPVATTNGGDQP